MLGALNAHSENVSEIPDARHGGATAFGNPQRVTIVGYSGDAMEPFISRDDKYLFFNSSNSAPVTNLFWATRTDDVTFEFQGELSGVNAVDALNAVASMDVNNNFFFVSNRSYTTTFSTIYSGAFSNGEVTGVALAPGVSPQQPGLVDFDEEISADGNTLYFSEGVFGSGSVPKSDRILIAQRVGNSFVRDPHSNKIFKKIDSSALNYATDTSASELELFFTRLDPGGPAIYMASRSNRLEPFGKPQKITAIKGFAEAPSISPDGKSLYYHFNDNGTFVINRVTRP